MGEKEEGLSPAVEDTASLGGKGQGRVHNAELAQQSHVYCHCYPSSHLSASVLTLCSPPDYLVPSFRMKWSNYVELKVLGDTAPVVCFSLSGGLLFTEVLWKWSSAPGALPRFPWTGTTSLCLRLQLCVSFL